MEISTQSNNYQTLNAYQKRAELSPAPIIVPSQPESKNENIYEGSQGNLINNKDGEVVLTPQGKTNLSNKQDENAANAAADQQAAQDAKRGLGVDYIAHQSKQSQVEIYLSVATDSDVDLGNDTASIIESLRDVQKQNNAVAAYATYEQNQNKPGFVTL